MIRPAICGTMAMDMILRIHVMTVIAHPNPVKLDAGGLIL